MGWYLRLGLRNKLMVAFVVNALLTLTVGLWGAYNLREISLRDEAVYQNNTVALSRLSEVQVNLLLQTRSIVRAMGQSRDQEQQTATFQRAREFLNISDEAWEKYERTEATPEETKLRETYTATLPAYIKQSQAAIDLLKEGRQTEAETLINGSLRDLSKSLESALDDIVKINDQQAREANTENLHLVAQALSVTVAVVIGAFAIALGGGIYLAGMITRPIQRAIVAAKRIANNDLTEVLRVEGSDEVAQLTQSLSEMQQGLRETLKNIASSSSQLAAASEELHAVTEDMSRSLNSQNDQLQMAATAVTEMSAAVDEVARSANDTSTSSSAAEITVGEGRKQVGHTRAAIEDLAHRVGDSSASMRALAQHVVDITSVLDVIGSIAEQTNLLALNAAIEAARAGEQGRGFSVVADEVRALAARTQDSTREIAQMIDKVKTASQSAAESMADSNEKALHTRDLADAADGALEQIATAITRINHMNLTIASASEEQAATAREVDKNLVAIRDIADQNATGAHQTSAASNDLARIATELNMMVGRFRL